MNMLPTRASSARKDRLKLRSHKIFQQTQREPCSLSSMVNHPTFQSQATLMVVCCGYESDSTHSALALALLVLIFSGDTLAGFRLPNHRNLPSNDRLYTSSNPVDCVFRIPTLFPWLHGSSTPSQQVPIDSKHYLLASQQCRLHLFQRLAVASFLPYIGDIGEASGGVEVRTLPHPIASTPRPFHTLDQCFSELGKKGPWLPGSSAPPKFDSHGPNASQVRLRLYLSQILRAEYMSTCRLKGAVDLLGNQNSVSKSELALCSKSQPA
ncbi:hypothetical protein BDV96DRAFT_602296 [Lophiotrema nucula]|uniref:Uncharacterized protein n=1 Tax=Lophiotrema nucula TaxID=690887 RepID=A0A6A5YYZ3_9PLEO|nr:hypothetical protein BDV96DRAFT_602296 [Lophiotrema nucula]